MSGEEWAYGPFGLDAVKGQTIRCERTVLVVAHSVTAATRLADIVPLVESDRRVQVVYTWAPSSVFSAGVRDLLGQLGGVVIPWQQAARTRFDLAIAASHGLLEQLHAPVLRVPHGVGFSKYPSRWAGPGPAIRRQLRETDTGFLIHHGRVIAAGIVVATESQLEQLTRWCPEAAEVAAVAGDPCLDRLVASQPFREAYRRSLGLAGETLVAVSSTWGPGSVLGRCPDLLPRLMDELPPEEYRVAAIIHPNCWYWHGPKQMRAWFADCERRGLILVPPEEGWRAVLAAADVLVGDHGSVTCYGASIGVPVALAAFPGGEVQPRSQVAALGKIAPRLHLNQPIGAQLGEAAGAWCPNAHRTIRNQVTSAPGQAAGIIRAMMYRLMRLAEPATPAVAQPVSAPKFVIVRQPPRAEW